MKETLKEAGYRYIKFLGDRQHVIQPLCGKQPPEVWVSNKDHASYGIIYKNTHLEFCRTADESDLKRTRRR